MARKLRLIILSLRLYRKATNAPAEENWKAMVSSPKMYEELAKWWPLLSPPEEYEDEAEFFLAVFEKSGVSPLDTMVEFGSGGGSNAFYFKNRFALTLVDI